MNKKNIFLALFLRCAIWLRRIPLSGIRIFIMVLLLGTMCATVVEAEISSKTFPLTGGTAVPLGEFEAVGSIGNCTATLISWQTVLTAAHCVCPSDTSSIGCDKRRRFTLVDVFTAQVPFIRQNIGIDGTVYVHPDFGKAGWLRKDFALIVLDRPVFEVAKVTPITSAVSSNTVKVGEQLTLVGFGPTGGSCTQNSGKQKLSLTVSAVGLDGIKFNHKGLHACPGDSGGPAINNQGVVVGVASWSNFTNSSTYRPVYENAAWIDSLKDKTGWQKFSGPINQFLIAYDRIEQIHRLYSVDKVSGDISAKSRPGASWTRIGGPGKIFVLAKGSSLYGLSPDGKGVYQYQNAPGKWVQVGGPANTLYGLLTGLYATSPQGGNLWQYKDLPHKWVKIGGPGKTFASDGKSLYGLAPNGSAVYRYDGIPGKWTKIGGPAGTIFGGLAGLFATNPQSGDLWHYQGTPNVWKKVGGPGKSFAVGWNVYGLSPDGSGVYQYDGTPQKWTRIGNEAGNVFAGGRLVCASNPKTWEVYCYNPMRVSW